MSAYQRLAVAAAPEAVVPALREVLRSRALTEYGVVDDGRDMAAAGAPGFSAWTLILATRSRREAARAGPRGAIDIALRISVIAGESGSSEIVLRDMRSMLSDDLADPADAFTKVLQAIATAARDRAASG